MSAHFGHQCICPSLSNLQKTIPEALKLQEASNELNTSLTFLSLSFCRVNLVFEPKEKGGSGREERRMRRSCRYRRRRSHSLCRDVRGVGGCTLHRWTTLLHSGTLVSTSKGSRCHVCTPLLLFSSSAFAAPGTSSRPVGPFLPPIHKEPLWKRAAS